MVSILRRMTKLRALLAIRVGPGAARLPPNVTRIHMDFAMKDFDGHRGSRIFWRTCLPRLKYYNPTVPMTVTRSANIQDPALLKITFGGPAAAAKEERTEVLDIRHKDDAEILAGLMDLAKATPVRVTPADAELIKELEQQQLRSAEDSKRSKAVNAQMAREADMLRAARGELVAGRD